MAQQPIELILLRLLASYLAVPVWIMDSGGDLVFYNEPAEKLLGRGFEEAGPISVGELADLFVTTAEDGSPLRSEELPVAIALLKEQPAHARLRYRGLDGAWRLVAVTAFPIVGQSGRHLGAVAIFWEADGQ
jgi:PAS domain-containing protein